MPYYIVPEPALRILSSHLEFQNLAYLLHLHIFPLLNTRQESELHQKSSMNEEFKLLHQRIGDLHDKQLAANKEIEQRLDRLDQYKSKLMGMIVVVGGALGVTVTLALHFLD